ncbi:MAG: GNAT family N-acetyltransferase [Burkholderiaceae bacterium]|nr:GNAT family N-acetyltransferase [Burkholderiaceae bacterium]
MPSRPGPLDLSAAPRRIETARTVLEVPCAAHADAFAAGVLASMPALLYVDWHPQRDGWAARFCADDARCFDEGSDLAWHVFARDDGGWVGRIDVHTIDRDACRGEIGYVGHAARSGQGLMREAVLAVLQSCWVLDFQRIEAMSDARNTRALRFAEQVGLQREGLLRRHERDPQGRWCDIVILAALNPQPPMD